MRICDVNNFYSPTGGGVRVYHQRKLDHYAAQDEHAYALVVPGSRASIERRGAATIYEVPALPAGGSGYRVIATRRHLRRVFADFQPDLVEIGSPYLLPLLVPGLLGPRVATVGFVHADYPDTYVGPALGAGAAALARRHMRWIYGRMSATFGASEQLLGKLAALGLRRLFHAPLGVEVDVFDPSRRSLELRRAHGIADDERLVLFMGRLSGEKGIADLLAVAPRFADAPGIRLAIAGHGPAAEAVAALARAHPRILRIDAIAGREAVAAWMASAELFLALGPHETFSLTTLESMAAGTPVVAPRSGGAAELVDRFGFGLTFEPGSIDALESAIRSVVGDVDGPGAGPAAASRRAEIARHHAWPVVFARLTAAYARIVEAHRNNVIEALEAPRGWWPAAPGDPL
ncbi:MAG: glycosyltransferase [Nannocystaceae bacterium]